MSWFKTVLCGSPTIISTVFAMLFFEGMEGIIVIFVGGFCSLALTTVAYGYVPLPEKGETKE